MKVLNTTAKMICMQTKGGRVDIMPAVVTDNDNLDDLEGNDKVFDFMLAEGQLKKVSSTGKEDKSKLTPKEKLQTEAELLGIEGFDKMTVTQLEEAIAEENK